MSHDPIYRYSPGPSDNRPVIPEGNLPNALQVVYNHMHKIQTADRDTLLEALEVFKNHIESNDWTVYVP